MIALGGGGGYSYGSGYGGGYGGGYGYAGPPPCIAEVDEQ